MDPAELIRSKHGLIATVCLSGTIQAKTAQQLANLRSYNDRHNIHGVEYRIEHAVLVEQGRDLVVHHALKEKYAWLMMIDGDAAPIPHDITETFLRHLYVTSPALDMVGAYAQLRGAPYRPTIDTGTGTWEDIYPGRGLLRVIRTGGHCFMAKTSAYMKVPAPWYKTRQHLHPARALMEVDNFCRTVMDGRSPLADHPEWPTILAEAASRSADNEEFKGVGEDSSFCDRLAAAGGVIAVDTDVVVGHIDDRIIMPEDFIKAHSDSDHKESLLLGVDR